MLPAILSKTIWRRTRERTPGAAVAGLFPFFCNGILLLGASMILLVMFYVKGDAEFFEILEALSSRDCLSAFMLTLKTSAAVVCVSAILGLPMACSLAFGNFRGKLFADALCDLPLVLPPLVSGIALLALLNPETFTGGLLRSAGVKLIFTPAGIVLAQTFVTLPLFVRTASESMGAVSKELLVTGKLLGGTALYRLIHIVLPLSARGILAGLLLAWARALGEFGATAMVAGCVPQYTETMPVAIYVNILGGNSRAAGALASLLMITALAVMGATRLLVGTTKHA